MRPRLHSRLFSATLFVVLSFWAASCAVPLGPGYTIEKQQMRVRFTAPEPQIRIEADYQLKNTGTRTLHELEMRLPGRRFHVNELRATWDTTILVLGKSPDNPRNTVVPLAQPWNKSARHTLHLAMEFSPAQEGETALSFSSDAFFLPGEGWSTELLPPTGLFATGGVPPQSWELLVAVPEGFLLRTSGKQKKSSRRKGELTILAEQQPKDRYPFVIAGRYRSAESGRGKSKIHLWTRKPQEAAGLREASDALAQAMEAYDATFGVRKKESLQTWIVECPVAAGCFTNLSASAARLLGEDEKERIAAEMISQDTIMVDFSGGPPKLAAAVAPSLATSWLGYAQSPRFYEQDPPLSLLPLFAASIGREAVEGANWRAETIRRALRRIPATKQAHPPEDPAVLRAKSFLFFYALQDRYGREAFRKATQHMLQARRERGFKLDDLIAAFEQETHQNVAEYVRLWMKHPGVPEEFRAWYESAAAARSQIRLANSPRSGDPNY